MDNNNSENEKEKSRRTEPPSYNHMGHADPLPSRKFSLSAASINNTGFFLTLMGGFWSMLIFGFTEYRKISDTVDKLRDQVAELRANSMLMKDQLETCRKDLDQVENHLFEHEENDKKK